MSTFSSIALQPISVHNTCVTYRALKSEHAKSIQVTLLTTYNVEGQSEAGGIKRQVMKRMG